VSDSQGVTRRQVLSTMGMAGVGVAAGVAGGMQLGYTLQPPLTPPSDRRRFDGKVVLITGATSGIGRAAAIRFAAEGAKVGFCGRRVERGHAVEQEIRAAGGEATYMRGDVLVEEQVRQFVDGVVVKYGRLDVAFNNAGITTEKLLHEFTAEEWDLVINTNLRGVFFAMKYEIPHFIAAGGGRVVVTSSTNAIATAARRSAYASSKRALVAMVQAAALEYGPQHIRVNALIPGTTDTDLVRRVAGMERAPDLVWEIGAHQWAKSHVAAAERMATADEIAAFALVLASDEHPYLTGASFVIDGGMTAHA
jgi:NAD(P)-dependent dehydrogenase (short-subunit alcohol dehydrogenase family)